MAASNGSPPRQPRVPAWKRLGLKLKYAKEDVVSHSPQDSNHAAARGHLIGDGTTKRNSNDDVRPQKKRKISPDAHEPQHSVANRETGNSPQRAVDTRTPKHAPESNVENRDHGTGTVNDSQVEHNSDQKPEPTPNKTLGSRRKSVTFTTDTKQEEEFSALSLFEQWSTDRDSNQNPTAPLVSPTSSKKGKKKQKRAERTKDPAEPASLNSRTTKEHDQTSNESVPGYIAYLQLYHTDRQSWKFNKKKQKDLLKNLFSIDRIPPEHNDSILQYIAGLQGAGARQRVIESATAVLKEIAEKAVGEQLQEDMESEEARRNAYSAALKRHFEKYERAKVTGSEHDEQQIEEMRRDAEKGKRADKLLRELLREELYPNPVHSATTEAVQSSTSHSGEKTQSRTITQNSTTSTSKSISKRKRRKARTKGTREDSTSDRSESEGDYNPERGPATVHDALSTRSDPRTKNTPNQSKPTATKKIFDDELLDQIFPKKRTYYETTPKRDPDEKPKARGFTYTHGTRADESGSEDQ